MTEKKETKTLIQAIAEFQKSAPIILKSATNPFFKSKYADLPAVWHTIKDLMSANGLAVVNLNVIIEGQEYLETRIYHTGGEYLSSVSRLSPVKSDPQSVGSAITYMRRYALMSLLGLVADDDDDANQASGKTKAEKPVEKQPVKLTGDALLIADAMNSATSEKMLTQIGTVRKADIDKMPDDVKHELKIVYSRKLADLKNVLMAG
jgi:hypothetical protein